MEREYRRASFLPIWCWASLKRAAALRIRRWPVWATALAAPVAIITSFAAGELLGTGPGLLTRGQALVAAALPVDALRPDRSDWYAFAVGHSFLAMVVVYAAALISGIAWSLSALKDETPTLEETFR